MGPHLLQDNKCVEAAMKRKNPSLNPDKYYFKRFFIKSLTITSPYTQIRKKCILLALFTYSNKSENRRGPPEIVLMHND
jgi:hypothetical protein